MSKRESPRVSICTTVFNRRAQFKHVLSTIAASALCREGLVEVVACDRGSLPGEAIGDLPGVFPFLRLLPTWSSGHVSPIGDWQRCVEESRGDIVLIQSAECAHVGDVCAEAEHVAGAQAACVSFACYAADLPQTIAMTSLGIVSMPGVGSVLNPLSSKAYTADETCRVWMQHSTFRPCFYLSHAMRRKWWDEIGGFDMRYLHENGYEDCAFDLRMSKYLESQGIRRVIGSHDGPFLVHLWHDFSYDPAKVYSKDNRNAAMYREDRAALMKESENGQEQFGANPEVRRAVESEERNAKSAEFFSGGVRLF